MTRRSSRSARRNTGKPILVRAYNPAMSFEEAVKLLMLRL